jgi:hypothetical protein
MARALRQSGQSPAGVAEPGLKERVILKFPILCELRKIARSIPRSSWDKLPRDLSANLDHYIYGVPKK